MKFYHIIDIVATATEREVETMKEQAGKIIDFVRENRTVPGCTISKQIYHENGTGISIFCLEKVF